MRWSKTMTVVWEAKAGGGGSVVSNRKHRETREDLLPNTSFNIVGP